MAISEFSVTSSNTNAWASVETSAVGGSAKYGIYVTTASNPRYTFVNSNFYPSSTSGSVAIVELYANSEGSDTGDPNTYNGPIYDGVALVNTSELNTGALYSNTSVYGINSNTKHANYVYNFSNNGYADTKKMAIGGNKNRRVFAIRSWNSLSTNINQPYIAFIGDSSALKYNGTSAGYSVGCAGATRTTSANTWVSHIAGDGTKYYSITNTTAGANVYTGITLTQYHTYRFTLHAHTEASWDGVAICKTTNTTAFSSLGTSDLISGNTSTGKCSGKDRTTTFDYAAGSGAPVYIYFKSDSGTIGPNNDGRSFADVMVEDLGDLRAEQDAPTAANVTVEYGNTATASATGGEGQGALQYRIQDPSSVWSPWLPTVPTRTAIGTTIYRVRYAGNASYKPSPASNVATLQVTPKKITKPTAVLGLQYDGFAHDGINNVPDRTYATSEEAHLAINAGNYSTTYTLTNTTNYCWDDGTTAPITVNWKITPLTADLIWGTTSWLYDGTAHSTTCRVGNLVESDTCTVTLSGNSITYVGTTIVTATALSNSNYRLPATDRLKTATLTIHPCMYIKAGGEWTPVIAIYKKVNGSWVMQTTEATIKSLFSEEGRYLGLYNGGSGWKNLIDG